jgi:hypothetical protein
MYALFFSEEIVGDGDTDSFHPSIWDEERLQRQQIHFNFIDDDDDEVSFFAVEKYNSIFDFQVMMKMRSVDIPVKKKKSIIKFQML